MAKLALVALALTAIVAISAVSAYRTTIITTTVEDMNRRGSMQQCQSQTPMSQLNHCEMHLTQGMMSRRPMQQDQQHLQQCCSQLKRVSEQCQCDAIQQVFDEARQQGDVMEMRQMLSKAQMLPTECRLGVQECPLVSPRA